MSQTVWLILDPQWSYTFRVWRLIKYESLYMSHAVWVIIYEPYYSFNDRILSAFDGSLNWRSDTFADRVFSARRSYTFREMIGYFQIFKIGYFRGSHTFSLKIGYFPRNDRILSAQRSDTFSDDRILYVWPEMKHLHAFQIMLSSLIDWPWRSLGRLLTFLSCTQYEKKIIFLA